jgi:hypothetical protein
MNILGSNYSAVLIFTPAAFYMKCKSIRKAVSYYVVSSAKRNEIMYAEDIIMWRAGSKMFYVKQT